jgi:hypothetical protein
MTQVLDFPRFYKTHRKPARQSHDAADAFWPEVTCQTVPDDVPVDPANMPGRVLFEILLVLATAGAVVAAVTFLVPG